MQSKSPLSLSLTFPDHCPLPATPPPPPCGQCLQPEVASSHSEISHALPSSSSSGQNYKSFPSLSRSAPLLYWLLIGGAVGSALAKLSRLFFAFASSFASFRRRCCPQVWRELIATCSIKITWRQLNCSGPCCSSIQRWKLFSHLSKLLPTNLFLFPWSLSWLTLAFICLVYRFNMLPISVV